MLKEYLYSIYIIKPLHFSVARRSFLGKFETTTTHHDGNINQKSKTHDEREIYYSHNYYTRNIFYFGIFFFM